MTENPTPSWTEKPHWVTVVIDGPGEEHCAGHWPTEKQARTQAKRLEQGTPFPKIEVRHIS